MTTPKELAAQLGIDSKELRKFARKNFTKTEKSWNFSKEQIEIIHQNFSSKAANTAAPTRPPETEAWYTIEAITKYAQDFLKEYFNGFELDIPIEWNGRLKRKLGIFWHKRNKKQSVKIELAKRMITDYDKETVLDTLRHELVHYALYELDQPYHDGDAHFEQELRRCNATSTNVTEYRGLLHIYTCTCCNKEITSRTKFRKSLNRRISRCCSAKILYSGSKRV